MEHSAPSVDNKSLCLLPIPFTSNFLSPAPAVSAVLISHHLSLHSFVSSRGGGGKLWRVQSPGRGSEEHRGWQLLVHEQTAGRHPGKRACSFVCVQKLPSEQSDQMTQSFIPERSQAQPFIVSNDFAVSLMNYWWHTESQMPHFQCTVLYCTLHYFTLLTYLWVSTEKRSLVPGAPFPLRVPKNSIPVLSCIKSRHWLVRESLHHPIFYSGRAPEKHHQLSNSSRAELIQSVGTRQNTFLIQRAAKNK